MYSDYILMTQHFTSLPSDDFLVGTSYKNYMFIVILFEVRNEQHQNLYDTHFVTNDFCGIEQGNIDSCTRITRDMCDLYLAWTLGEAFFVSLFWYRKILLLKKAILHFLQELFDALCCTSQITLFFLPSVSCNSHNLLAIHFTRAYFYSQWNTLL